MNGKKRSDKDLLHLGLPPMELAESNTNVSERSNNTSSTITSNCMYSLLPKLTALFIIILLTIGSYLTLAFTLQSLDYSHNTEIIVITGPQARINSTNNDEAIKVVVKLLNKTSHSGVKRQKRAIPLPPQTDNVNKEELIQFNEKQFNEARNIIANYDINCNEENQNDMCKDLVTKLKAVRDTSNTINENKGMETNSKKNIVETTNTATSTEKAKRETSSLFQDVFKTTPNLHFDSKTIESYLPNQQKISLTDACLLARLLKDNYPHLHGGHEHLGPIPSYGHPTHGNNPHSGFLPGRSSSHQSRDVQPQRHHQDVDLFMKFLDTQQRAQPCNGTIKYGLCSREANCPEGTFACSNGEGCIPQNQWCDGKVDCDDVSDEIACTCKSRIHKSRICDGYFDCPFGEDEMGCFGCAEFAFSCGDVDLNSQSTCFTKEQRCNNVVDCPNHKDEIDCTMLAPSFLKKPLFAISNTEGFLHRNFKGEWYPVCQNPYMWAHEACRRETGLIVRPPFIQLLPIDPMLKVNYVNTGPGGWIQMTDNCFNSSAVYVTCPDMLCGTRDLTTVQTLREDEAVENHLFGRNKRFFNAPYPLSFYFNRERRSALNYNAFGQNILKSKPAKVKRAESRVVGGRPSQPAAWPWLVAMYRDGMFHCGGVIVNQNWIVSAAHCVFKFWDHYYEIQVGMLRRFSYSPQERNYVVTHIIVNHGYSQEDMRNDVSLLRVKPAIVFSRWVRPVCLPGPETAGSDWKWGPRAGTMCVAVGWGATVEHGPDPDHLREVEVPIWDKCKHKEDRAGNEICAGNVDGGRDACQGDSGGPLLCRNPMNNQQWYMAGIVSHGDGCARKDEPGVYTRVSLFTGWIRFHVFSKNLPEIQPKQTCPGFKCVTGILKCIPNKRVCDKVVDCLGAEDELNCETKRNGNNENIVKQLSDIESETTKTLDILPKEDKKRSSNDSVDKIENKVITKYPLTTTTEVQKTSSNISQTTIKTELFSSNLSTTTESLTKEKEKESLSGLTTTTEFSVSLFDKNDIDFPSQDNVFTVTPTENIQEQVTDLSTSIANLFGILENDTNDMNDSSSNQSPNVSDSSDQDNHVTETSSSEKLNNIISSSEENSSESNEKVASSITTSTDKNEKSNVRESDMNTFTKISSRESLESDSSVLETKQSKTPEEHEKVDVKTNDQSEKSFQNVTMKTPEQSEKITLLPQIHNDQILMPSNKIESQNGKSIVEQTTSTTSEFNGSKPLPKPNVNSIIDKDNKSDLSMLNTDLPSQETQDFEDSPDNFDNLLVKLQPAKIIKKHHIPNNFECRRINQTIPYKQRCDNKPNCEDGTDELDCTCADFLTTFDEKLLCDGIIDCSDGQDERDCFICNEGEFLCKSSQLCLPLANVCDRRIQCPHGEDELDCFALSNGKNIIFDFNGRPTPNLEGYLTIKHGNDWHIMCEDNMTLEDQDENAHHICRYLGFSSANRYQVKYINVKEDELLKQSLDDQRSRREIMEAPIHFTYKKVEDDKALHLVIKEPQVLKEQCVPNITKTCMSLYVYCDHSLFFDFDTPQILISSRASENSDKIWPWAAKVYSEGEYRCTGVLIDISWVLVSNFCLWDSLISHHITVVVGSQRTLHSTTGQYEQIMKVDAKKYLYHNKAMLLHLKEPASYSSAVKPMVLPSANILHMKPTICVALGQDGKNTTVSVFLQETNDNCSLDSRCYERQDDDEICSASSLIKPVRQWAGIVSCYADSGWYPAATFIENRGECGFGKRIVASEIENLRYELKDIIGRYVNKSIPTTNDLCEGQRCGRGQCIRLGLVCDGVRNCHDGSDESEEACLKKHDVCSVTPYHRGCDCSSDQMKCRNGKCVAKELYKDGRDDCGDGTDEPAHLDCSHYLSRVRPSRQCDGIVHCKDRSDEDPLFCRCFAKQAYKCRGSNEVDYCVANDMICDGIKDCPEGDDENVCIGQSAPAGTKYGTGQVIVRSHGVWYSKCYNKNNHTKSELEAICSELGFISGHAKQLTPPENTLHKFNDIILDKFIDVKLNNNTLIQLRNTDEPLAKAVVSETVENCFPMYIECL